MTIQINFNPKIELSESFDLNFTLNEIIELAFEKVGGKSDGQNLTNEQFSRGKKILNMMVKNWRADNVFLWDMDWITVPFKPSSVVLGTDGSDYECIRNHVSTEDNEPVTGLNYISFWKKLATNGAGIWIENQNYSSIANISLNSNILDIEEARLKFIGTETTKPMTKLRREEWFSLNNVLEPGQPIQFYFRKRFVPELFLHPFPDSITDYVLEFFVYKYPDDFDLSSNNSDFVQEWLEPLVDGLAERLATSEGIFGSQLRDLQAIAARSKEIARKADNETGDLIIVPDFSNFSRSTF